MLGQREALAGAGEGGGMILYPPLIAHGLVREIDGESEPVIRRSAMIDSRSGSSDDALLWQRFLFFFIDNDSDNQNRIL